MKKVFVVDEEAFENDWVSWHDGLKNYMSLCPINKIDELTSIVPVFPFPHLRSVVERAKAILANRSSQEIEAALVRLQWIINSFFHQFRNESARRIELCKFGLLHEDHQTGRPMLKFWNSEGALEEQDAMEFICSYPIPSNTSEFMALKNCISEYDIEVSGFQKASEQEYFAALALWLAADCIDRLNTDLNLVFKADPNNLNDGFRRQAYEFSEEQQDIALASIQCSEALNAVTYAEQLAATASVKESVTRSFKHAASISASGNAKIGHKEHYELNDMAKKLYFEIMEKIEKGDRKEVSTKAIAKEIYPKIAAHAVAIQRPLSPERGPITVYEWLLKAKKNKSVSS